MKNILFILTVIAVCGCMSVRKNVEYRLENKKGKTHYPYTDDLSITLTSDTSGVFTNIRTNKDTIRQKFMYHNQVEGNDTVDIFRLVKRVDRYSTDRVLLNQNDTLIFYKKGIYLRYKAPNKERYLLYFNAASYNNKK